MSPARYAPIPNPHTDPDAQNEMEAAFLDSDDEDDERESSPNSLPPRNRNGYQSLAREEPESDPLTSPTTHTRSHSEHVSGSGTYDFERVDDIDWARPPPGSPPPDALSTFRQALGNSNGLVPDFSAATAYAERMRRGTGGWIRRVVPDAVAQRLGMGSRTGRPVVVGGGTNNDGVFANVTAKPSRPVQVQEGDNVYLVPEESQKDAPPSYASAQADAVPPYWETTIHAPSASTAPGDMVVDSLPTGSLFSFLWNMLVSISFQFVGFLLTYLLHTTHAAKLGSRAGLGVTLIQYGFAMRSRAEEWAREGAGEIDRIEGWGWQAPSEPVPTFATAAEADEYYGKLNVTSLPSSTPTMPMNMEAGALLGDATTEWLSFFLMTVGWFILLTSLLSFWRVKRWERGILTSSPASTLPMPSGTSDSATAARNTLFSRLGMFRAGLGFSAGNYPGVSAPSGTPVQQRSLHELFSVPETEEHEGTEELSSTYVIPIDNSNPERTHTLARAYADEARLHRDLRAAGLL